MIASSKTKSESPQLAVIDIGNTDTVMGVWKDGEVSRIVRATTQDEQAFAPAFGSLGEVCENNRPAAVVVASVVPDVLERIRAQVKAAVDLDVRAVGSDVPLPMPLELRSPETVGVDRVCSAAAAFERVEQTCIIVDFGTAITADLVSDVGTFLGGAILPGAALQVRALHEYTAALPNVEVAFPPKPIGNDTDSAIRSGVCNGIVGAVRGIVETFAATVGKWPQVVATGGDLKLFAGKCDFLDSLAPDLCLLGIGLAWAKHAAGSKQS